ncbi:MAG TPA: pantetheine-phosphate adenylyltransferase [Cytophaga sp.]|nr:pantetheine-phosphate adenylyltransferase [Cytophaga sp.]
MNKIAVFPGSFDPFTKGHEDIVRRSLNLFDKVIIAIGNNSQKSRYFDIDFIVPKIKHCFLDTKNVEVVVFKGLTADFAKQHNANFLIRGLRNTTDFEYENSISQANKYLWKDLETVFMITSPHLAYISSSLIRDIHKYNGDVSGFLPYEL